MKKWSVADKIAFAALILTLIGSIFGFYQYKATQRKEEITLKINDSEYERYWIAKYDFSIDLPNNWIVQPQPDARDGVVCTHPTQDIEMRAAGVHYDRLDRLEIFKIIDNSQFPNYDFESEVKNLNDNDKIRVLLENRVKKYEQFIDGKTLINSDIPAKFIVFKYFNKEKNMERVKTMLMIAGKPGKGEMDYEIVFVYASVDSSVEFYEANKDLFSKIVLSLNFGRKKL
jgi:hypothetical protein